MATPANTTNVDTTREESQDSKSNIENPIQTDSPNVKASSSKIKAVDAVEQARLEKQAAAAQTIVDKNLDSCIFELETEDLELLESRVAELEKYLGIEDMDMDYFVKNGGEDLNKKAQVLEDFKRVAEDKYFCINELFAKFEKMDTFLKHERRFEDQCMDLKQKTTFITDWLEELQTFLGQLEQIKSKEKHLSFEPIVGKLKQTRELLFANN